MADWVADVSVSKSYDEVYLQPTAASTPGTVILYDQKPATTIVTLTAENVPESAFTPPSLSSSSPSVTVGGYTGLLIGYSKRRVRGTNLYSYTVTIRQ